ncbi:MAG: PepSY-associated TM helix domain-containing protein [Planctomycetes bacterium]|nr:PepSY-associated TM helix domain-containing protein [Planctomycetota bacterium]
MSIRVAVSTGCNGMGSCVRLAPQVFRIDPATGRADVLLDDCSPHREAVLQASRSCPFVQVEIDGVPLQERIDDATVIACERLTPDIVELRLRRPGFAFVPGQYVFLRLDDEAGQFFRTYSVVGSADGVVTLCIRLVGNGRAGRVLAAIRPSVRVGLSQAKGLFALRSPDRPKLFVTGGTGLAPVVPMCEAAPAARKLVVIGARAAKDLFWLERLRAIPNTEVVPVVQNPGPGWNGAVGLSTAPLESLDVADWPEVYTCGSPGMVEAVRKTLVSRGMPADRIHSDSFVPAGTATPSAPAEAARPARDWPGLIRRWHYIASAPLALIIIFYAITGFIANRSDLFVREDTATAERLVPEGVPMDREHLAPVLAAMAGDGARLDSFSDGRPLTAVFAMADGHDCQCTVDPERRSVRLRRRGTLPPDLPLNPAAIGSHLAGRLGGQPDLAHATNDEDGVELELASVWGTHRIQVDRPSRTWTCSTVTPPWSVSLVDLHRGKNAGGWQRALIDVTAMTLALVTLSGVGMSLLAASARRRGQALILLAAGAALLASLVISR